jgi:hypothetical protein
MQPVVKKRKGYSVTFGDAYLGVSVTQLIKTPWSGRGNSPFSASSPVAGASQKEAESGVERKAMKRRAWIAGVLLMLFLGIFSAQDFTARTPCSDLSDGHQSARCIGEHVPSAGDLR